MRPVQPSVVAVQRHVMLSAVPSSGIVNSMIRITGIGDRDRPEWLIRISGIRNRGLSPPDCWTCPAHRPRRADACIRTTRRQGGCLGQSLTAVARGSRGNSAWDGKTALQPNQKTERMTDIL